MSIKIDLLKLGKKQIDLLAEVRRRGYPKMYESQLSLYLSGRDRSPQGAEVIKLCKDIINDWKSKQKER